MLYGAHLVMFRIIAKPAGNRHGFLQIWMNKVSMATPTAAIHKACLLQDGDQLPYLRWHPYDRLFLSCTNIALLPISQYSQLKL